MLGACNLEDQILETTAKFRMQENRTLTTEPQMRPLLVSRAVPSPSFNLIGSPVRWNPLRGSKDMNLCDLCLLVHGQCIILVSMALLVQGCVAGVCNSRRRLRPAAINLGGWVGEHMAVVTQGGKSRYFFGGRGGQRSTRVWG